MNEGQYDSKNVEHISIENIEVVSNGMDWKSRHLEAEKRKKIGGTASQHLPYRMLNKIFGGFYHVFDYGLLRCLCRLF